MPLASALSEILCAELQRAVAAGLPKRRASHLAPCRPSFYAHRSSLPNTLIACSKTARLRSAQTAIRQRIAALQSRPRRATAQEACAAARAAENKVQHRLPQN